ncbi:hypothetical protein KH5H1_66380 [Corallococcus caeni]|uniref:addiction module protein n=1 Tax=Corallococcus caeni TaxID=3082388 RepID=UPI0029578827|nr:hypothetical protein KH5H1_66380 [Corallococcus sp. KH5-1]
MVVMATVDELIAQVLRLSPDDRARLVREVSDSLDEGVEASDAEAAWGEEVRRRAQEVLDGTVKLVSLEEVERKMEERARRRR